MRRLSGCPWPILAVATALRPNSTAAAAVLAAAPMLADLASPRPERRVRDLWLFDSVCGRTRGRTPKPLSGRDRGLCFTCLAASFLAGRAPRYGGDRGVGAVQRLGCSGRRITALGDQREAMHQRPG
jgi:hypothetical protein